MLLDTNTNSNSLGTVEDASPDVARDADLREWAGDTTRGAGLGREAGVGFQAGEGGAPISPWDEPDDFVSVAQILERSGTPARLGVLPSPAAETFSLSLESPPRTADGGERKREESIVEDEDEGSERRQVLQQSNQQAGESVVQGNTTPPRDPVSPEDEDELYESTPTASRTLPRNTTSLGAAVSPEDEDQLYESTPVASKTPPRNGKDNEGLYERSPKTPENLPRKSEDTDELYEVSPVTVSRLEPSATDIIVGDDDTEGEDSTVQRGVDRFRSGTKKYAPTENTDSGAVRNIDQSQNDPETVAGAQNDEDTLRQPQLTELRAAVAAANVARNDIPSPPTPKDVDRMSMISSPNDIKSEDGPDAEVSTSRRSSVSSLGNESQSGTTGSERLIMSSRAGPAGPTLVLPPDDSTTQGERFMNRPYNPRESESRQLSYLELARDSTGALVPEMLDTKVPSQTASVNLSTTSGGPAGTPPIQQHPMFPDSTTGDIDQNQQDQPDALSPSAATPLTRHRKQSNPVGAKRFSGFFRGREQLPGSPTTDPAAAGMFERYINEGSEDNATGFIADGTMPQQEHQQDQQNKRRSSLFDAFKRSPSVSKPNSSRESSKGRLDAPTTEKPIPPVVSREESSRAKTLKKPQRASTSAAEAEPKKKRFSGLGSLFGRSSTTGHKAEKGKKLLKEQPPNRDSSRRQASGRSGSAGGYEAYEKWKRQQVPNSAPARQDSALPAPLVGPTSQWDPRSAPPPGMGYGGMPRPQESWYGISQNQPPPQLRHPQPPTRQQIQRLDSGGSGGSNHIPNVPEAFQPIESSYNKQITPIRPPEEPRPQVTYFPTSPAGQEQSPSYPQPPFEQQFTTRPPQQRIPSSGSNEYQLSPQVSGQSDWQRSDRHSYGSLPSVSPIQTRGGPDGFPTDRGTRIGSISEEVSRSPARDYPDQQTPWAIAMPSDSGGLRRGLRSASHRTQSSMRPPRESQDWPMGDYDSYGPPANTYHAGMYQQPHGLPMSPETPNSSISRQYGSASSSNPLMSHAPLSEDPQMKNFMYSEGQAYPSPPYTPQSPSNQSYSHYGHRHQRPPQGRYYAQYGPNQRAPPSHQPGTYGPQRQYSGEQTLQGQRPPASYTSRRDDPTVGEEALEMKGVSYPGQEWTPTQWD